MVNLVNLTWFLGNCIFKCWNVAVIRPRSVFFCMILKGSHSPRLADHAPAGYWQVTQQPRVHATCENMALQTSLKNAAVQSPHSSYSFSEIYLPMPGQKRWRETKTFLEQVKRYCNFWSAMKKGYFATSVSKMRKPVRYFPFRFSFRRAGQFFSPWSEHFARLACFCSCNSSISIACFSRWCWRRRFCSSIRRLCSSLRRFMRTVSSSRLRSSSCCIAWTLGSLCAAFICGVASCFPVQQVSAVG